MIPKTLICAATLAFSASRALCVDNWQPGEYLVKEEIIIDYLDLELTEQVQMDTVFDDLPEYLVNWDIDWDAGFNVSLEIEALVPRLVNETIEHNSQAVAAKNVELFEFVMRHSRIARYEAEEIKRNHCQYASYINPYWRQKSQQLTNELIEVFSERTRTTAP